MFLAQFVLRTGQIFVSSYAICGVFDKYEVRQTDRPQVAAEPGREERLVTSERPQATMPQCNNPPLN